jgi:hypothetical protein
VSESPAAVAAAPTAVASSESAYADPVRPWVSPFGWPVALVLGWLVPGLGHRALGYGGKGLLTGGTILAVWVTGYLLSAGTGVDPVYHDTLYLIEMGVALPTYPAGLMQAAVTERREFMIETGELGRLYLVVAGLLNVLLLLDVLAVSSRLKAQMPAPPADAWKRNAESEPETPLEPESPVTAESSPALTEPPA